MAFTDSRTYDAGYQEVLNTAEDVLVGMGFDLRYRNGSTGRLLCHSASSATGATGWLDLRLSATRKGVTVLASTDTYDLWSNRRLLDILGWFFHHLDVRMGVARYTEPPARGVGAIAPYEPEPSDDGERPVLKIDPPGRTIVASLALLPALVLLVLASFQVEGWKDLALVLGLASPFIGAAVLAYGGLMRAAGGICLVFSIFSGMLFGVLGWLLVFVSGEYAGHMAMVEGRWWTFRGQTLEEMDDQEDEG